MGQRRGHKVTSVPHPLLDAKPRVIWCGVMPGPGEKGIGQCTHTLVLSSDGVGGQGRPPVPYKVCPKHVMDISIKNR